ncbi:hypothetical protein BG418_04980 [Streptomyces sp. CBMA152]|nr:hypothetical protein [Streptomyces sp. CBMA152]
MLCGRGEQRCRSGQARRSGLVRHVRAGSGRLLCAKGLVGGVDVVREQPLPQPPGGAGRDGGHRDTRRRENAVGEVLVQAAGDERADQHAVGPMRKQIQGLPTRAG